MEKRIANRKVNQDASRSCKDKVSLQLNCKATKYY